jgi:GAF domain-containing protein
MTQGPGEEFSRRDGRAVMLARRFVALADTLVDDYDVVDLMEGLVQTCVDLLEVDQAGLLLTDQRGNLQLLASSSETTSVIELLQLQAEEGPCVECVTTGLPISAGDLPMETGRWPTFAPAAIAAGFVAVHSLPMRLRDETVGGLNLFTSQPGHSLGDDDRDIAQALADVATIGILQQRSISRTSLLAEQLQTALNSRIAIEQAKGVVAERGALDMPAAFAQLRTYARNVNAKLADVATAVVRGELDVEDVLSATTRHPTGR